MRQKNFTRDMTEVNVVLHQLTKIILTRCQIFHLKCTKFNRLGLPRPPSWIWDKGKGKEKGERGNGEDHGRVQGVGMEKGRGRRGREREREGGVRVRGRGNLLHEAEGNRRRCLLRSLRRDDVTVKRDDNERRCTFPHKHVANVDQN